MFFIQVGCLSPGGSSSIGPVISLGARLMMIGASTACTMGVVNLSGTGIAVLMEYGYWRGTCRTPVGSITSVATS